MGFILIHIEVQLLEHAWVFLAIDKSHGKFCTEVIYQRQDKMILLVLCNCVYDDERSEMIVAESNWERVFLAVG